MKALALDWCMTTVETSARHRRRLSDQFVTIGVAESLRATALVRDKDKARGGRARAASTVDAVMHTTTEEAEL